MVTFQKVTLVECQVGGVIPGRDPQANVQITHFARSETADGKGLEVLVSFDLLRGIDAPAVTFKCTFRAAYTCDDGDTFGAIKDHVAVAHLVPFLREFVWNMTARLSIGGLMIPPMPTHILLADYKRMQSSASALEPNSGGGVSVGV